MAQFISIEARFEFSVNININLLMDLTGPSLICYTSPSATPHIEGSISCPREHFAFLLKPSHPWLSVAQR